MDLKEINYLIYIILIILSLFSTITEANFNPSPELRRKHKNLVVNYLRRRKISDQNSNPQVLNEIHDLAGCPGEICGTLAGEAVQPLLAGAPECAQQDMADKIIDIAKTELKEEQVRKKLIELAKKYRRTERNTFPDYSIETTPDTNSLYCLKEAKNEELRGIIQEQSSTADPNLFFDPKVSGKSIRKGTDPRTKPFGQTNEKSNGDVETERGNEAERKNTTNSRKEDELNQNKTSSQRNTSSPTSTTIDQTTNPDDNLTNPETGDVVAEEDGKDVS